MMITQGSKDHPVILNDFLFGDSLKKVHWEAGFGLLTITWPNDADYDITPNDILTRTKDTYKIGSTIDKSAALDKDAPLIQVRFDDADNPNPVETTGLGHWKKISSITRAVVHIAREIEVQDQYTPNRFHDEDQARIDLVNASWQQQISQLNSDGVNGYATWVADLFSRYPNGKVKDITDLRDEDAVGLGTGSGSQHVEYNDQGMIYWSGVFPWFDGPVQFVDIPWYTIFTAYTGNADGLIIAETPIYPVTLSLFLNFVPADLNQDVWIVDLKKLGDRSANVVIATKGKDDPSKHEITLTIGDIGDFKVAKDRTVVPGTIGKIFSKGANFDQATNTVLATFNSKGFV